MNTRNKYRILFAPVALATMVLSFTASANTNDGFISIGANAGTLGAGLELDIALNEYFNVRLQGNQYDYSDDFDEDGITYTGDLELSSVGLLADYRPFGGIFRVSGGIYSNQNALTAEAISDGSEVFEIGNLQYTGSASDPLTLNSEVELGSSTAGYLGLGWGNSSKSGFAFTLEIGAFFGGSPKVSLEASGTAVEITTGLSFDVSDTSNPLVQQLNAELENETTNLEEEISEFDIYPVISIGIAYRF